MWGRKVWGLMVLGVVLLAAACQAARPAPTPSPAATMTLTSDAFQHGAFIPARYTCDGEDVSPPLSWSRVPEGTRSFVLIVDDPDAPAGTFVHWVLYNIPAERRALPEGVPPALEVPGIGRQGTNDFRDRRIGYRGPCPPPGKPHRYFFKLYALDAELDVVPGASAASVARAMEGHVLGQGVLMGRYGR